MITWNIAAYSVSWGFQRWQIPKVNHVIWDSFPCFSREKKRNKFLAPSYQSLISVIRCDLQDEMVSTLKWVRMWTSMKKFKKTLHSSRILIRPISFLFDCYDLRWLSGNDDGGRKHFETTSRKLISIAEMANSVWLLYMCMYAGKCKWFCYQD